MAISETARRIFKQRRAMVLSDLVRSVEQIPFVPLDRINLPLDSALLDSVGVRKVTSRRVNDYVTVQVPLVFTQELAIELPGLQGTSLVLASATKDGADLTLEMDLGPN